jgi:hypothetical protein
MEAELLRTVGETAGAGRIPPATSAVLFKTIVSMAEQAPKRSQQS